MTTFNWTSLINNQTVTFDPNADILNIDDATITAGSMSSPSFSNSNSGNFTFTFAGKTITLTAPLASLTTTNVTFADGSRLLVGDDTTAVGDGSSTNDDAANTLTGTAKDDTFFGLIGNDTLNGGDGNDSFFTAFVSAAFGNDAVNGGNGSDTLIYVLSSTNAVTANLATHAANNAQGNITLSSIEAILGTAGADSFTGGDTTHASNASPLGTTIAERFRGNAGNDTITGGADFFASGKRVTYSTIADYANNSSGQAITVNLQTGTASDGRGGTDTLSNVDQVRGGDGADSLTGGSQSRSPTGFFLEIYRGNAGNDTLNGNNSGTDGDVASNDRADYSNNTSAQAIVVDMTAGTVQDGLGGTDTLTSIDQVVGGDGNDTFTASSLGGVAFEGGGGNDTLTGGFHADEVRYLSAMSGIIVNLSAGAITVNSVTVNANSAIDGLGGTDSLTNIEIVRGSDFADYIRGSDSGQPQFFDGRGGNDTIVGGTGIHDYVSYSLNALALGGITATISNGSGTISDGLGGIDTVTNIEGIVGTNSADSLTGGLGEQLLRGLGGNDTLNGGADVDVASYESDPAGVTVNLALGTATDGFNGATGLLALGGTDTLISIEWVYGSRYGDVLTGSSVGNALFGFVGNDTLTGGLGQDDVNGGDGDDLIYATHDDGDDVLSGSHGFDILDYSQVNGVVQINQLAGTTTGSAGNDFLLDVFEQIKGTNFDDVLSGGHGINVLDGEGGNDQFFGNNGDDLMRGGTGNDTFYFSTSDGNDTLLGGDGFDILDYSSLLGVVQVNQLAGTTTGTANNDTLADVFEMVIGSNFDDVLSGGHGPNSLKGNGGDDQIFANNGDDYMSGGTGYDTLTGGVGNDTQDMRNGEGIDTWLDFTAGGTDDTITLTYYTGLGFNTFAGLQASGRLSTVSGHAELALNGEDRIVFSNVASHTLLTAADFVF